MPSEFKPDYLGVKAYLIADDALSAYLYTLASQVLATAQDIAPVGEPSEDPDSGEYKASLFLEKHLSPSRMSYRVGSTSKKAWWIEYGTKKSPKFAVLRRALDHLSGNGKSISDYAGVAEYDARNAGNAVKRSVNRTKRARKTQLRKGGK